MSFAESGFAQFMSGSIGRIARIVVGLALIGWGYTRSSETGGIVVMVIGLVPLAAGVFNMCFIGPLLGGPLRGADILAAKPKSKA